MGFSYGAYDFCAASKPCGVRRAYEKVCRRLGNHTRNREAKDSSSKVKGMSHRDKSTKLKVK
jgi:hypothetical protein